MKQIIKLLNKNGEYLRGILVPVSDKIIKKNTALTTFVIFACF